MDKAKDYTVSEIIKSPIQLAFFSFAIFTLASGVLFWYDGIMYRNRMMAAAPKGYPYPMWSDLWLTGLAAILFSVTEVYIFRPLFHVMFRPFCKE